MPPKRGREDSTEPDGSLDILACASEILRARQNAISTMQILEILCGYKGDPKYQQIVWGSIVIQRDESRIYAHHITDPTVTYDMDRLPYYWMKWLKTILTPKKQRVEEPVPTRAPDINSVNDANFNTLLCLLTKLPKHEKLVIIRQENGKIILQVLGILLDAVITIENGDWFECSVETEPDQDKLRVPWETSKPNEPLSSQLMMIPVDTPTWSMEIIGCVNLVGIHHYANVVGNICLTSPKKMEKILFDRSQRPRFNDNKNLVVVKTTDSPFNGVVRTFKKRVRDGYQLDDDELIPLKRAKPLDKVIQDFKQNARF